LRERGLVEGFIHRRIDGPGEEWFVRTEERRGREVGKIDSIYIPDSKSEFSVLHSLTLVYWGTKCSRAGLVEAGRKKRERRK
jgi:hypothetical protein